MSTYSTSTLKMSTHDISTYNTSTLKMSTHEMSTYSTSTLKMSTHEMSTCNTSILAKCLHIMHITQLLKTNTGMLFFTQTRCRVVIDYADTTMTVQLLSENFEGFSHVLNE